MSRDPLGVVCRATCTHEYSHCNSCQHRGDRTYVRTLYRLVPELGGRIISTYAMLALACIAVAGSAHNARGYVQPGPELARLSICGALIRAVQARCTRNALQLYTFTRAPSQARVDPWSHLQGARALHVVCIARQPLARSGLAPTLVAAMVGAAAATAVGLPRAPATTRAQQMSAGSRRCSWHRN